MKNVSDRMLRLLIDPGYRVRRHLLLLFMSLVVIFVNFYLDLFTHRDMMINVIHGFILLMPIYLSIFVLTPRLLLKNRVGGYFFSIFLIILFALMASFIIRKDSIFEEYKVLEVWVAFISFVSSAIILVLIITGASAVVVFQHYLKYGQRIVELENTTMQSELEQLKNQINPHFLFNMLNNANVLIKEDPAEAVFVLSRLKDLLKYQLKDSVAEEVKLDDDIHFLTDYLNMEKIRRDNFDYIVSAEGETAGVKVPPLLFIPFVENAVKHNNDNRKLSYVHLFFKVEENALIFVCINSKPTEQKEYCEDSGIGLANIRRRLQLLYESNHSLEIDETDITYTVRLRLNLK